MLDTCPVCQKKGLIACCWVEAVFVLSNDDDEQQQNWEISSVEEDTAHPTCFKCEACSTEWQKFTVDTVDLCLVELGDPEEFGEDEPNGIVVLVFDDEDRPTYTLPSYIPGDLAHDSYDASQVEEWAVLSLINDREGQSVEDNLELITDIAYSLVEVLIVAYTNVWGAGESGSGLGANIVDAFLRARGETREDYGLLPY